MKNEAHALRGIMRTTSELPTIKKLEIYDDDDHWLLRFCGIMIAAALSCLTFVYFPM